MNRNDVWNLFMTTGNINYYMIYKRMLKEGVVKLGTDKG